MSTPELETAQQFQAAAEVAMRTGDFDPLVALLTPDVECVVPQHTLHGVDAFTEELRRARPSERFELEFEDGGWTELGNGRYSCAMRVHYRSTVSDELSYSRDRSFELTIRDGKVGRYEMRFAG
jgi:ketosteroid isomerase-like protein